MPSEGVDDGSYPGAKQGKAGLFSVECEVCGREYDTREEVAEDHRPGCTIRRALEARGQTREQLETDAEFRAMTDGGVDTDSLVFQQPDEDADWHLFDERTGESLCGAEELDQEGQTLEFWGASADEYEEDRDCEMCCREAGMLEELLTDGGIQTDLHPSRQTSLSEADEESEAHDWCPGPEGLEDGELPCWDCFAAASQEQRDAYNAHPDTPTVRYGGEADGE